jgi:hypothetical protein
MAIEARSQNIFLSNGQAINLGLQAEMSSADNSTSTCIVHIMLSRNQLGGYENVKEGYRRKANTDNDLDSIQISNIPTDSTIGYSA